ncbi:6 dehydratase [Balamuthia mandrillaris]
MLSRGGQQFGGIRGGGGGSGVSAAAWGSLATPQPRPSWWQGLSPRTKQSLLALFALVFVFALYRLIVPPSAAFNPSSAPPRHHVKQKVLLTGGAGFIGSHTALALLSRGDDVIIVDEVNNYYDVSQKEANLRLLQEFVQQKEEEALRRLPQETGGAAGARTKNLAKTPAAGVPPPRLRIHRFDICDREAIAGVFAEEANSGFPITHICHLAARAGVRPSIEDPDIYVHSNVQGTLVMLDMARDWNVTNFVYASSSSVYGGNTKVPFAEEDPVDNPVSPYAATKKATELIASTYNHLYGIPMAGLRFFTVYGPRGRPDMAPFIFLDRVYRFLSAHCFSLFSF